MTHVAGAIALELAEQLVTTTLAHVVREYPHKADHVMGGPEDGYTPRAVHPIFYGSFDWHSCVHGYWLLARLYRCAPDLSTAPRIARLFEDSFTSVKVEVERAYLDLPWSEGFERPYGWAWLLMLAAELRQGDKPEFRAWAATLQPLADAFASRFRAFLPKLTYPVRAGVHTNTAFALALAARYAQCAGDAELFSLLRDRAVVWFGQDRDAPAWEPSGDDFLSPTLIEAEAMRSLLSPDAFLRWFDVFLPRIGSGQPAALFEPATVSDRSDVKIAHLDGLNLSRAWCLRSIAGGLPETDRRRAVLLAAADGHLAAAAGHIADDYMGEHWLATYLLLALST